MTIIWKAIPGFEGYYEASTDGNIRSIDRMVQQGNRTMKLKGRILVKQFHNRDGYEMCVLSVKGKHKTCKIHRLIALTFVPNPDNKPEVNHINGIKRDNRVKNLEWSTGEENIEHSFSTSLAVNAKRPICVYDYNGDKLNEFKSIREASRILNIPPGNICKIIKGRCKSYHSLTFKYKNNII